MTPANKLKWGGRGLKYPWPELDAPGKSVIVRDVYQGAALRGAQLYWKKRTEGSKFTSKSSIENGIYIITISRVA